MEPTPPELVRIGTLATRSGVPAPTIKHYLREGLLPPPAKRTARNMAYYDAGLVHRIVAIKQLQREHFLPLQVIKDVLAGAARSADDETTAATIAKVLSRSSPKDARTRAELQASGVAVEQLGWLEAAGLITSEGEGDQARYSGDDLALLRVLGAARRAGIRAEMLPTQILADYVSAIRELVRVELCLFRAGVLPRAGTDLAALTDVATTLSERLVVLIRRKLLLPTLRDLGQQGSGAPGARPSSPPRPRRTPRSTRRKP